MVLATFSGKGGGLTDGGWWRSMTPEQTFGQLLGLGKSWRVVESRLPYCESTSAEPAGEMFGDLHVGLNSRRRIAAGLQIESKLLQDYAQMAGGHPTERRGEGIVFESWCFAKTHWDIAQTQPILSRPSIELPSCTPANLAELLPWN